MTPWKLFAVAIAGLVLVACGSTEPKTVGLSAQSFQGRQSTGYTPPGGIDAACVDEMPDALRVAEAPAQEPGIRAEVTVPASPSPRIEPAAAGPADATKPVAQATTRPASASLASGTWMIVGTLAAEANGQPIYADRVLAKLDNVLSSKAGELNANEFRRFAAEMVKAKVEEEIRDELEIAAAERNTSEEDKQLASGLTTQWRQKEITKAGGSLAVARRLWRERENVDFDERVKEQYRRYLVILYYQKYVWNRVQISADDMRRFYERNLGDMFTEKSAIRFRVIMVSAANTGSRELALDKARAIHEKAKRGEDFARLAMAQNDDKTLARNKGFMDMVEQKQDDGSLVKSPRWYERGSLAFAKLEEVLFDLNEKELTDILENEADGTFYIARLEEKQSGRVRMFEEELVQQRIADIMKAEQRQALRKKEQQRLLSAAVVRDDQKLIETAIEMAMQKYVGMTSRGQ